MGYIEFVNHLIRVFMTIAVYPGTFDPLTRGHQDIVRELRSFRKIFWALQGSRRKTFFL